MWPFRNSDPKKVNDLSLQGQVDTAVQQLLQESPHNLVVTLINESNPKIKKGRVIRTEPAIFAEAPNGSAITVFVSTGGDKFLVSNELKVLLGLVAAVTPIMLLLLADNQNSDRDSVVAETPTTTPPTTTTPITTTTPVPPTTILIIPEFKLDEIEGRNLRYDPCDGPITVAINYGTASDAESKDATSWVNDALIGISRESGLKFVFTGATDKVPNAEDRQGRNGSAAILIGLLAPGEMGALMLEEKSPFNVTTYNSVGNRVTGSKWTPIDSTDVQINRLLPMSRSLILRSLLDGIGLDYIIKSPNAPANELMVVTERNDGGWQFEKYSDSWGPGDILGMKEVGIKNGCIGK